MLLTKPKGCQLYPKKTNTFEIKFAVCCIDPHQFSWDFQLCVGHIKELIWKTTTIGCWNWKGLYKMKRNHFADEGKETQKHTQMESSRSETRTWIFKTYTRFLKKNYTWRPCSPASIHLFIPNETASECQPPIWTQETKQSPCSSRNSLHSWVCSSIIFWKEKASFIIVVHKYFEKLLQQMFHFPYSLNTATLHLLGFGRERGVPCEWSLQTSEVQTLNRNLP